MKPPAADVLGITDVDRAEDALPAADLIALLALFLGASVGVVAYTVRLLRSS